MTYIDTHTHNYDEAYASEEEAVIQRALDAGVRIMIQPDVDSGERGRMIDLVKRYPDNLRMMLGLYPGSVGKNWQEEIDDIKNLLDEEVVAIGEIGLDYHYCTDFVQEQKDAFVAQLSLAAQRNLPVNIHLRDATDDFFDIISSCRHLGLRGNLHAFSGSFETFCRLQKYGDWYVGIGGVVTFKKAAVAESVGKIPLERIVLETDSPYLTPVPKRGTRNESSLIPLIAAKIAEIKGLTLEEVANQTTENALRLFEINRPKIVL